MQAAKERRFGFWLTLVWLTIAVGCAVGISFMESRALDRFGQAKRALLVQKDPAFRNLFQASYYFYFREQFVPGVRGKIADVPDLMRLRYVSTDGKVLYDTLNPSEKPGTQASSEIVAQLGQIPTVTASGFNARIIIPVGQFATVYDFEAASVRQQTLEWAFAGVGLLLLLFWAARRIHSGGLARGVFSAFAGVWGLRSKVIAAIILVNAATAAIVFFTLTGMQTREQSQNIERESALFSKFSTGEVISDFSNYFYFYYQDRFLPAINAMIATNENLVGIRIISDRSRAVLFDSESASSSEAGGPSAATKASFPDEAENLIRSQGFATRTVDRDGEKLFSAISDYRNQSGESLFLVEYLFSYRSLARSIQAIRHRILLDLLPSMAFGLLVAILLAQFLISPIRKLVKALRRVAQGDFGVRIDLERGDELGELVGAFNGMTSELEKKKELRKYLSDSTYRQIMEAPVTADGSRRGGSRVSATVLFSDIRDFVKHCENLEAEEVTSMLNEYFSEMVDVVHKHGGEVDKFIGDALLAVFYDADSSSVEASNSTALQAIYCGLEMKERLVEFNRKRQNMNKNTIDIGVGITRGEIISGPIGSKDRMDFTVIGDVVNLASRIEKMSKGGKYTRIVFSDSIEEKVRGLLEYESLAHDLIQGIEGEVSIYELIQIKQLSELAENLRSSDAVLRARSVELLGHSRNPGAIPHIVAMLKDPDEGVRIQAVLALGRLAERDDPAVLDALFGALDKEKSKRVISGFITAIGKVCNSERVLALKPYLDDADERIVANAVEAMGQVRSPKCADLILEKLSSRGNRVKANAAMALFAAGKVEVIDLLKPMLMHSDPLMRSSAAFAIGELTLLAHKEKLIEEWKSKGRDVNFFLGEIQESVPMLVALLRDPEVLVKRQAIIALGKIKDKSTVLPIIDMIDIESDSKEMMREVSQALWSIGSHKMIREVLNRLS